jgi:hypothetical protein
MNITRGCRKTLIVAALALLLATTAMAAFCFVRRDSAVLYRKEQPKTGDGEPAVLILNPFRDRNPERAADGFLRRLRDGRCRDEISTMPRYSETRTCEHEINSPLTSWGLRDRLEERGKTELFYRYRADNGTSEGSLRVWLRREGLQWRVADYERY